MAALISSASAGAGGCSLNARACTRRPVASVQATAGNEKFFLKATSKERYTNGLLGAFRVLLFFRSGSLSFCFSVKD